AGRSQGQSCILRTSNPVQPEPCSLSAGSATASEATGPVKTMSCGGPVVYGSAMDRQSPPREPWEVRDNPERKRFEVDLGDACAIAEYTLPAGLIMFTHTEVPPDHGGKGIGTALIQAG